MVAAIGAADVSVGGIRMGGGSTAESSPGGRIVQGVHGGAPARVAPCPHERRSGARGEALWTPVGDPGATAYAAELSAPTRRRRREGPLSSMR